MLESVICSPLSCLCSENLLVGGMLFGVSGLLLLFYYYYGIRGFGQVKATRHKAVLGQASWEP